MAFDWFKRKAKNITTSTEDKKDVPRGLWHQTPTGKIIEHEELKANNYVSPEDGFHVRIGSREFFSILFDDNKYTELDANVESVDMLNFKDTKSYTDRLKEVKAKTKLTDSIRNAVGTVNGEKNSDFVYGFCIYRRVSRLGDGRKNSPRSRLLYCK